MKPSIVMQNVFNIVSSISPFLQSRVVGDTLCYFQGTPATLHTSQLHRAISGSAELYRPVEIRQSLGQDYRRKN